MKEKYLLHKICFSFHLLEEEKIGREREKKIFLYSIKVKVNFNFLFFFIFSAFVFKQNKKHINHIIQNKIKNSFKDKIMHNFEINVYEIYEMMVTLCDKMNRDEVG